jgi:hypothetical protein
MMNKCLFLVMALGFNHISGSCQKVKSVVEVPDQKIVILSGNPDAFKKANSFRVTFDYADLKVEGYDNEQAYIAYMMDDAERRKKGSSEYWLKKWYSNRDTVFQPKFMELFSKYGAGKFKADTVFKNQQYMLNLHTQFVAIGFNKNFTKSPTYINVQVTLKGESNIEPLVISMENVIGDEAFSSYSPDFRRIEEAYAKCGKELARFMLKSIY